MQRYLRFPMPPKEGRNYADLIYLTWVEDPTTSMTIQWHTVKNVAGNTPNQEVKYREEGKTTWSTVTGVVKDVPASNTLRDGGRKVHWTFINGLNPDTGYQFMFSGDRKGNIYKFKTMPAELNRPIKITFASDPHEGVTHENSPFHGEGIEKICKEMAKLNPDIIIGGGDYTYDDGVIKNGHTEWWVSILQRFNRNFINSEGYLIPFLTTVGNHDTSQEQTGTYGVGNAPLYSTVYAFPITQNYLYGSLEFGNYLQLLSLDTDHGNPIAQCTDWLTNKIDGTKKHVIPFFHRPFYEYRGVRKATYDDAINQWMPLFQNAGVKIALNGHLHNYYRTKPIQDGNVVTGEEGIVYCGNGAWGLKRLSNGFKEPVPEYIAKQAWADYDSENVHHFYFMTLDNDKIKVEAINREGVKFDEFERQV